MKFSKRLQRFFRSAWTMYEQKPFAWFGWLSLILLALTAIVPIWRILPLAEARPYIPLHYNIYLGVDSFGPLYQIFFIPAIGFAFLVLNSVLQILSFQKERFLAMIIAVATVCIELLLCTAMILIVLLNLSYAA